MCGKYYKDREFIPKLTQLFREEDIMMQESIGTWEGVITDDRRDVNPTDRDIIICAGREGITAAEMKWGFRDPYHDSLVINARSESVYEKQMFAESIASRRCVIPVSGYYEWDKARSRYTFRMPDGRLVLLLGIYRKELGEDHYTILTTEANSCMAPVHPRMPVMIEQKEIRKWLTDDGFARDVLNREQAELEREQDYGQITMDILMK